MYQYVGWVSGKVYAEHRIKSEAHRLLVAQYPSCLCNPIYPEPFFIRKVIAE